MCRNIKMLHNFEPPATSEEIHASALQYVRKISGMRSPSRQNTAAFEAAVEQIVASSQLLLSTLVSGTPARNREEQAAKAKARWQQREARSNQS